MKKLFLFLKSIFAKKDQNLDTRLKIIATINKIKHAVNSPLASVISDAIPGRTDDAILECIRKWIPEVLKFMDLSNNGLNTQIAIKQTVETLKEFKHAERSEIYKVLGGKLYASFTGLPLEDAKEAIQETYKSKES